MKFNTAQLKDAEHKHFYLATISGVITGVINNIYDKKLSVKLLEYSELSFTVYKLGDDNDATFDELDIYKRIFVEDIGWFIMDQPTLVDDGETIKKECTAHSAEYELTLRNIQSLAINTGDVELSQEWLYYRKMHPNWDPYDRSQSVDLDYDKTGKDCVAFYRTDIKELSLMDLVLEKFPNWSMGYISPSLIFDSENIDNADVIDRNKKLVKNIDEYNGSAYSYLNDTVANAYKCIFVYDCINFKINAYTVNEVGETESQNVLGFQTDLFLTHQNIIDNANLKANTDDSCVTMIEVNGGDDVDILDVNIGTNKLYNFDYYLPQMNESLQEKVIEWRKDREKVIPTYRKRSLDANEYGANIVNLKYKTPETQANTFTILYTAGEKIRSNGKMYLLALWLPEAYTYKYIGYNGNGGMGCPSRQKKMLDYPIALSDVIPTRVGYTFKEWNTMADGSGTSYSPSSIYSTDETLILYAIWKDQKQYAITFDSDTTGATNLPSQVSKLHGEPITLPTTIPTLSGKVFRGWATSKTADVAFAPGSMYKLDGNKTLYAKWATVAANTMVVTFNGNGVNSNITDLVVNSGATGTISGITPYRTGYEFKEWNTKLDGTGTSYAPNGTIAYSNGHKMLYAIWNKSQYSIIFNSAGGSTPPDDIIFYTDNEITLPSETPTMSGNHFLGWEPVADATTTESGTEKGSTVNVNSAATTAFSFRCPDDFDIGEYVENIAENQKGGYINCDVSLCEVSPALTDYGTEALANYADIYEDTIRAMAGSETSGAFKEAVAMVKMIYQTLWGDNWYYKKTGKDNHKPSNVGCADGQYGGMYKQIKDWTAKKDQALEDKENLFNTYDITKYFNEEELFSLYSYVVESSYEDSTYVITSLMNNSQIIEVQDGLREAADLVLSRLSQPQYTVEADILNIFRIKEMEEINYYNTTYAGTTVTYPKFSLGNFVTVQRDKFYSYPLRLIGVDFEFDNPSSLNATFSNVMRDRRGLSDLDYLLKNLQTGSVQQITGKTGSVTTNTGSSDGGTTVTTVINNVNLQGAGSNGYTLNQAQYESVKKVIAGGTGGGSNVSIKDNASGGIDITVEGNTKTVAAESEMTSKQDKLVSGTNIKTVNNQSLLGNGNIEIDIDNKQDKLTAGDNITISDDNVISSTGGTQPIELTKAEYDALGDTVKTDGKLYFIKDWTQPYAMNGKGMVSKVLWSGKQQTTGTITLNDSADNYDLLLIRVGQDDTNNWNIIIPKYLSYNDTNDAEIHGIISGYDRWIKYLFVNNTTINVSSVGAVNVNISKIIGLKFCAATCCYSTDEQIVGQWIDGKILYQKVLELDVVGSGNILVPHGLTNLDSIIVKNVWSRIVRKNIITTYDLRTYTPWADSASKYYDDVDDQYIAFYHKSNMSIHYIIVVQYTKTTD